MTASPSWVGSAEAHRAQLQAAAIAQARRTDAAHESAARMLLARYGILFRDLLTRESNAPRWRDLLNILRRLEARGEVRGGRFVSGFGGEQFALPEAVESLRESRKRHSPHEITVAAADPMNLVGIIIPGDRVPAAPNKTIRYRNGTVLLEEKQQANDPAPAKKLEPATAPSGKRRFPAPVAPPARPGPPLIAGLTLF